jgi:hypothetical protein
VVKYDIKQALILTYSLDLARYLLCCAFAACRAINVTCSLRVCVCSSMRDLVSKTQGWLARLPHYLQGSALQKSEFVLCIEKVEQTVFVVAFEQCGSAIPSLVSDFKTYRCLFLLSPFCFRIFACFHRCNSVSAHYFGHYYTILSELFFQQKKMNRLRMFGGSTSPFVCVSACASI